MRGAGVAAAEGTADSRQPVAKVAAMRLALAGGALPVMTSPDWPIADPALSAAIVVLHGRRRDADTYLAASQAAREASGPQAARSLLVVPQFLGPVDVDRHSLPPQTLRWNQDGWMAGDPALAPTAVSSYAVLDALLAHLSGHMPSLRRIVVAGHSGGAQMAQRYAVLGRFPEALDARGVALRFVIANPSSYVYFSAERPASVSGCANYDCWKYGMGDLPRYAGSGRPADLEAAYLRRHVTYLLGAEDTDTGQPSLDNSCAARAQGPNRLQRGLNYAGYLRRRHPHSAIRLEVVEGVGHDAAAMFGSAAGRAALFGNS